MQSIQVLFYTEDGQCVYSQVADIDSCMVPPSVYIRGYSYYICCCDADCRKSEHIRGQLDQKAVRCQKRGSPCAIQTGTGHWIWVSRHALLPDYHNYDCRLWWYLSSYNIWLAPLGRYHLCDSVTYPPANLRIFESQLPYLPLCQKNLQVKG